SRASRRIRSALVVPSNSCDIRVLHVLAVFRRSSESFQALSTGCLIAATFSGFCGPTDGSTLLHRIRTRTDAEPLKPKLEMLFLKCRESYVSCHRGFHFAEHVDD